LLKYIRSVNYENNVCSKNLKSLETVPLNGNFLSKKQALLTGREWRDRQRGDDGHLWETLQVRTFFITSFVFILIERSYWYLTFLEVPGLRRITINCNVHRRAQGSERPFPYLNKRSPRHRTSAQPQIKPSLLRSAEIRNRDLG